MIEPRLASWQLTIDNFCHNVFRTTVDKWSRLPVQWRGFVLNHLRNGHTADSVLDKIDRGQLVNKYDPQGAYDSFNGLSPE